MDDSTEKDAIGSAQIIRPTAAEVAAIERANKNLSPEQAFQSLETKAGHWHLENNSLMQTDPTASFTRIVIGDDRWMDCIVKAKVRIDAIDQGATQPGVGMLIRSDDVIETFYAVGLWADSNEVRIEKSHGLILDPMKTADYSKASAAGTFPVTPGRTYELTVVADHATIYCYVDGKFVVLAQEADFTTQPVGRIGFFTNASTGSFSNVSVKGLTGVTSSPFVPYSGNPLNVSNYAPAILKDDRYRLWDGYNELPNGAGRYAESQDGITWTRPVGTDPVVIKGHPGDWPEGNACGDPDVIKIDGEYWITFWSTSNRRNGQFDGMGIKRSRDGINWTPEPANPVFFMGPIGDWDELVVGDHAMIRDGGRFKMWHVGITRLQRGYRNEFGYAESEDGIHWRKCRLNPVLTQGQPGTWDGGWIYAAGIVKIDDRQSETHVYEGQPGASYHLFYTGQPTNNERICGVKRIGYAFSLDGINWVKWSDPNTTDPPFQDSDPVVTWSEYGQKGSLAVGAATAMLVDDEVRLYYSMYDDRADIVKPEGAIGMGLAVAKVDTLRNIVAEAKAKGLLKCASRPEIEAVLDEPLPQSMWDDLQGCVLAAVQAKASGDTDGEKAAMAEVAATRAKFTKALDHYFANDLAPLKKVVDKLEAGHHVSERVLWSLPADRGGKICPQQQIELTGLNISAGDNPIMIEIEAKCSRFQAGLAEWTTEDDFQAGLNMEFIVGYPGVKSPTYRMTIATAGEPIRAIRFTFPAEADVNLKQIRIRELRI